jgi:hypothetical protein
VSEVLIEQYKYLDCDPNNARDKARLLADLASLEKVSGLVLALVRTIDEQKQRVAHYHPTLDALDDFKTHVQESLIETIDVAISDGEDLLDRVDER